MVAKKQKDVITYHSNESISDSHPQEHEKFGPNLQP